MPNSSSNNSKASSVDNGERPVNAHPKPAESWPNRATQVAGGHRPAPFSRGVLAAALTVLVSSVPALAQTPDAENLLDRFDKDGDKALNSKEMKKAMKHIRRAREKDLSSVDRLMNEWDQNDNEKISRQELSMGLATLYRPGGQTDSPVSRSDKSASSMKLNNADSSTAGRDAEAGSETPSSQSSGVDAQGIENAQRFDGKSVYTTQGVQIGSIDRIVTRKESGERYALVTQNMYTRQGNGKSALPVGKLEQQNGLLTVTSVRDKSALERYSYDASAFETHDSNADSSAQQSQGEKKNLKDENREVAAATSERSGKTSVKSLKNQRTSSSEGSAAGAARQQAMRDEERSSSSASSGRSTYSGSAEPGDGATDDSRENSGRDEVGENAVLASSAATSSKDEPRRLARSKDRDQKGSGRAGNREAKQGSRDKNGGADTDLETLAFRSPDKLRGMMVVDEQQRKIGEVKDVVIKKTGESFEFHLLFSSDAFLGMGGDDSIVSINDVRVDGKNRLVLSAVEDTAVFIASDYLRVEAVE